MSSAAVSQSISDYSLQVIAGPSEGNTHVISSSKVTLGRAPENDICFNDPKVSRKHAIISLEGPDPRITDVSGKNHLIIDGERCKEAFISNGSRIQMGNTVFEFYMPNHQQDHDTSQSVSVPDLGEPSPGDIGQQMAQQLRKQRAIPVAPPTPHHYQRRQNAVEAIPLQQEPLNTYQAPHAAPTHLPTNQKKGNRLVFYSIVVVVLGLLYFLISPSNQLTEDRLKVRSSEEILKEKDASQQRIEALKTQKSQLGQDTRQYDEAQASYIRCFRDYQQGQYTRAIQHCQAALSIFPNHDLAERYLLLSQRKRDERMQFLTRKGKMNLERGHYARCMATLTQVMYDLKSPNHPLFQEARQIHAECKTRQEGRY